MPWAKTANAAMYGRADWDGYVKTVPDCSPQQAQRIARLDPEVGFFFHCRQSIVLDNPAWPSPRLFDAGDAIFFRGEPWLGDAPQCDTYVKDGITTAYAGDPGDGGLGLAGCYTTADGSNAVDVVCVFAANLNRTLPSGMVHLAPKVTVPTGGTIACAHPDLVTALESGVVAELQAKGISVLLTLLNNWDDAGWSEFTSAADAQNFVDQLQSAVAEYGLDGIDIDDEYSKGTPVNDSLAMVTYPMRQTMPEQIVSKALFADIQYFGVPYKGSTLEQTLTYGWEMSYGGSPEGRLPQYVQVGMSPSALSLGYWASQSSPDPKGDVEWLKTNGYAGVMEYAFQTPANAEQLGQLVDDWCGPGNWNKMPNCS